MGKYDEQVAYLKQHPQQIGNNWFSGKGIFDYRNIQPDNRLCLTMIRNPKRDVRHIEGIHPLVLELACDERMPDNVNHIKAEHLDLFASYNERMDEAGITTGEIR